MFNTTLQAKALNFIGFKDTQQMQGHEYEQTITFKSLQY